MAPGNSNKLYILSKLAVLTLLTTICHVGSMQYEDERLPVIDLSNFDGENTTPETKEATVLLWNHALEHYGFAAIINHDVSTHIQEDLFDQSKLFFEQPMTDKLAHQIGKTYGGGGYTPMGVESVGRTMEHGKELPPDLVENFVFLPHLLTSNTSTLEDSSNSAMGKMRTSARSYWEQVESLLTRLHKLSASALNLNDDFFEGYYYPDPSFSLRLAYYPPLEVGTHENSAVGEDDEMNCHAQGTPTPSSGVRYGAHTDYQGLTVLRPDPLQPGLEVLFPDGQWHDIRGELKDFSQSNVLIVNVGDLLSQWTNNRWKSALHRVSNPPMDSTAASSSRLSLVFFSGPRDDALIEVMPQCLHGAAARFEPVLSGDFLRQKLQSSNV